jgi:hypothetical protein
MNARLFLILLLVFVCPALADQTNVRDLQQICTGADADSKGACRFYILGVVDGSSLAADMAADKSHFCIPDGIASSQMEFVVKKAIGQDLMFYPKDRDLAAAGFIGAAIMKQWPFSKE